MNKLNLLITVGLIIIAGGLFLIFSKRSKTLTPAPAISDNFSISNPSTITKTGQVKSNTQAKPKSSTAPVTQNTSSNTSNGVAPVTPTPAPLPISSSLVCNSTLIGADGLDINHVITKEACDLVNDLYKEGKAAGNVGDTYENRDGLHVNFCEGWTPSPDCPLRYRFFPQHEWLLSGGAGRAMGVRKGVTIGQASYSGENSGYIKHSIAYSLYKTQSGADILYDQYTHNNLYIYPSLQESGTDNIANTPYVISSEDIGRDSDGSYYRHDASGSDLPFVKIAMLALASLQPEVKKDLTNSSFLIPTLQMLIRHAHRSVSSETDYLSLLPNDNTYHANYLSSGVPKPTYDSVKLVRMANSLNLAEVPPLARLKIISEDFTSDEKLFNTPGAIARSVSVGTSTRTIKISAAESVDLDGTQSGYVYEWKVLKGDTDKVKISKDPNNGAISTIEFISGSIEERLEVGVFIKKPNGRYYSVPGIVSVYLHS